MTSSRRILNGFLTGLTIFVLANILAAHLLSNCGLPAVLGASFCADDIVRIGFPLIFLEQGGFAYRNIFNFPYFLFDIFTGLGMAVFGGYIARRQNYKK